MEGLVVIKNLFLGNLPTFGLTTRDQANIALTCWKLYKVFTNQERALLATGMTYAEIKEQKEHGPYLCKKCGLSFHVKCPLDVYSCLNCFKKGTNGYLMKRYEPFFNCTLCNETKSRDFVFPPIHGCAWCIPETCDYEKCLKCLNYFKCFEKEKHLNCGFNNIAFFPPEN